MTDVPVKLEEPTHPEAREEAEQRASLVDAFEEEIDRHRRHVKKCEKEGWRVNRAISIEIGNALGRILEGWVEGYEHDRL